MLMFRDEIVCSRKVAAPLPTRATTATRSIVFPGTAAGEAKRRIDSQKMKAMTTDRPMLLTKAAMNSIFR